MFIVLFDEVFFVVVVVVVVVCLFVCLFLHQKDHWENLTGFGLKGLLLL